MEITSLTVDYYWTPEGRCPVREWRDGIRSEETVDIIDGRIARVRRGLLGHCDSIGGGLQGLKIDVGPGYRISFRQKREAFGLAFERRRQINAESGHQKSP